MSTIVAAAVGVQRPRAFALLRRELRLLLRARMAVFALLVLGTLSLAASWNGARQMDAQRARIAEAQALQAESSALVLARYGASGDAGNLAYHRSVLAWDEPAALGFSAVGQRDIAPWLMRVRALGLEAQIYEGEHANPALALTGRFDFAFVLVYLTPLVLIALLHDLFSAEREAGRLALLRALPAAGGGLWWRRAGLRTALVLLALCLPVLPFAISSGAAATALVSLIGLCTLYVLFWAGLCLAVASARGGSGAHAARLVGLWLLLCLVLPSLGQAALQRALPVDSGLELMLAQREEVHAGWDRPKPETFARFFVDHPEWRDTPPVETRFHWKWYYALQHAGDLAVREASAEYRERLRQRERSTHQLGWLLPAVATQAALHRLAESDLEAHLQFLDRVRDLHRALRLQLYPYVFEERAWTIEDEGKVPRYADTTEAPAAPLGLLGMLALWALAMLALGARGLRRSVA
ncbi:MAG: DUF3526 domain-containing protein [Xanthomonadales bacterium]|nr:DUF3526 domain-containing protein [Xanthomonadales bacterium]